MSFLQTKRHKNANSSSSGTGWHHHAVEERRDASVREGDTPAPAHTYARIHVQSYPPRARKAAKDKGHLESVLLRHPRRRGSVAPGEPSDRVIDVEVDVAEADAGEGEGRSQHTEGQSHAQHRGSSLLVDRIRSTGTVGTPQAAQQGKRRSSSATTATPSVLFTATRESPSRSLSVDDSDSDSVTDMCASLHSPHRHKNSGSINSHSRYSSIKSQGFVEKDGELVRKRMKASSVTAPSQSENVIEALTAPDPDCDVSRQASSLRTIVESMRVSSAPGTPRKPAAITIVDDASCRNGRGARTTSGSGDDESNEVFVVGDAVEQNFGGKKGTKTADHHRRVQRENVVVIDDDGGGGWHGRSTQGKSTPAIGHDDSSSDDDDSSDDAWFTPSSKPATSIDPKIMSMNERLRDLHHMRRQRLLAMRNNSNNNSSNNNKSDDDATSRQ